MAILTPASAGVLTRRDACCNVGGMINPVGCQCAWKGCEARFKFKNAMPHGWVWLITYWAPKPQLVPFTVPQKDMSRDGVLCPKHHHALEQLLVDLYSRLPEEPSAGSA